MIKSADARIAEPRFGRKSDLDYCILHSLNAHGQAMGSGSLHYLFRKQGNNLSAPTIGRWLRDLDNRGLVTKVSVEGRTLTPAGLKLLKKLEHERRLESSGETVLKLLKRNGKKDIVDQLTARRVIEGETCALAAVNATTTDLIRLEELLEQQRESVAKGHMGVHQDTDFHDSIAEASGNSVLAAMVVMLRSHERLNHIITAIRTHVGTRPVVDHETIVRRLNDRNPDVARAAMEQHINRLIVDVDHYWEQVFPAPDSH
jgi:DNA-binding FadR family transcriptional regulator